MTREAAGPQSITSVPGSGLALSIVVVNYNSWPDIERLTAEIASSSAVRSGQAELVVVDNSSAGEPPSLLKPPPPGVRLIVRGDNGGFSAGVNTGWRAARGRWILLLNPDVRTGRDLPGQVLERIAGYEHDPQGAPGLVGYGLRDPDGSEQPSVGYDPSLARLLRGVFLPRRRRKYQSGSRVEPGPVAWVTGACLLVNAWTLSDVGGMDEDFFLYYEEVALCREARRKGWRVLYDPSIQVVHTHPLQNRPLTPQFRLITRHSQLLFFRKHLPAWEFKALTWIVEIESRVRLLLPSSGREREASREVIAMARSLRRGQRLLGLEVRDRAARLAGPRGVPAPHVRADGVEAHSRSASSRGRH